VSAKAIVSQALSYSLSYAGILAASLTIYVGLAEAQGQGPVLNAPRTPSVGDTKTTKCNSLIIIGTYTGTEGDLRCIALKTQNGQSMGTSCVTAEGNTVRRTGGVGTSAAGVFNPHSGIYLFPLFVGKEWSLSYTFTNQASGTVTNLNKHAKIVSYEKVPAGDRSVDAFKIEERIEPNTGTPFIEMHYYSPGAGEVRMDSTTGDHCEVLDYSWKN
jgi:hypothetical protein